MTCEYDDPGRFLGPKSNDLWKPIICAVNGMACGGAFYMIAESDIVIAAEHATFFDPHVTYGQAAVYEPILLRQHISLGNVLRIALLGARERVSATTALEIGLITEVVTAEQLPAQAAWLPPRRDHDGTVDPVDLDQQGRHGRRQPGIRQPAPDQAPHPLSPPALTSTAKPETLRDSNGFQRLAADI